MKKKLRLLAGLLPLMIGTTSYGQYCSPNAGVNGCNYGDFISNVVFGSISNATGCSGGSYGNFTAMSTTMDMGATQNMAVSLNPDFNQGIGVFIDWNQDFDFDDAGEFFSNGNVSNASSTTNISITVPANAVPGTTRVRVACRYNNPVASNASCVIGGNYGEYEDYSLVVGNTLPYTQGTAGSAWSNPTATINNLSTCQGTVSLTANCGVWDGWSWSNGNCNVYVNGTYIGNFNGSQTYNLTPYIPVTSVYLDPTESWNWTSVDGTVTIKSTSTSTPTMPIASNVTYCQNATAVPLTATLTGTGTTLKWFTSAQGHGYSATAPTPNTSTAGTTSYWVSEAETGGCESPRRKIDVVVNALPSAPSASNQGFCNGAIVSNLVPAQSSTIHWYNTASTSPELSGGTSLTSGSYYATQTDGNGCESVKTPITVNLLNNTGIDVQSACVSYDWIDGNTYTSSNNSATYTLTNAAGCDSVVTLNLTIMTPTSGTDVQSACGSYDWIDGNTYTSSNNTATYTLTNAAGCDSVVTLNLTIMAPTSGTDVQSACGSYDWIDGNTYTSSNNTATYLLTNAAGCDSLVTLDLTILNPTSGSETQTVCDQFTWSANGNTYTTSGSYTATLQNAEGCDSVVTLDLTINPSPNATATDNGDGTLTATAGVSYQWYDCSTTSAISGATSQTFAPSANGNYAVEVTNANGCSDMSSCTLIDYLSLDQTSMLQVEVYPNPTSGLFTVQMSFGDANYVLTDANGAIVQKGTVTSGSSIDVSTYETGVYFLNIVHANGSAVKRIVKQ